MKLSSDLHCWEIMQCQGTEDCPARKRPEENCWEIAREIDDYRKAFNVCKDCVVYLLKNKNTVLNDREMHAIMKHKSECALA